MDPRSDEESSNTGPHPSECAAQSGTTYLVLGRMVVAPHEQHFGGHVRGAAAREAIDANAVASR